MNRFLCPLLLCALSGLHTAYAQSEEAPAEIQPDTADFVIGTSIVPRGHFQTETRLAAQRRGSSHEYDLGETLVRYGISDRAELRFGVPAYVVQRQNGRLSGLDDASIEAKFKMYEGKKTELGLYVDSILPTGSRRVAERRYQPSFRLTSSYKPSDKLQFLANLGARRASVEGDRFTQFIAVANVTYDVASHTQTYAEIYGFNRLDQGQGSQKFVATGVIQLLNDHTALDARVGCGLGNHVGGPDYFYELGFSRLF